jgi:type II secretion system protein H
MRDLQSAPGFTLVELIIVMGLLAIVAALSVPLLSNSLRQRNLDDEATRLVALTEYARDEAVSQGMPMIVSFDQRSRMVTVEPKTGFEGDDHRVLEYALGPDIQLTVQASQRKYGTNREVVEFTPEGVPTSSSAEALELKDRFNSTVSVAKAANRWGYEIVKPRR